MPKFPIYIPSKGRHQYMTTSRHLTAMGVRHFIVVEPFEFDAYRAAARGLLADVIPLDMSYKEKYDLCDGLGLSKSTGSGPARNFIWDHSVADGNDWHWIMDDNICGFFRFNRNLKVPCKAASLWDAMEDFVLRYENVAMAGPNYFMFVARKTLLPPFVTNTRIYSCNLIRNDVPFRWRGRYNEDVIMSLDMLKAGWGTIQFNAFLQCKMTTQTMGGGNSTEFYFKDGTLPKSQMLMDIHPDVSKVVYKFHRWHHHVDYSSFKANRLIRRSDVVIPQGINDYGMVLKQTKSCGITIDPNE
jgi:hypothetical protein